MWMTNRKTRYEVIKKLIEKASPELIDELVKDSDFAGYDKSDDPEYRRSELQSFLDEMNEEWNKYNIDVTDRQYIQIVDYESQTEEESELPQTTSDRDFVRVNPKTYRKDMKKTNI